MSLKEDFKRALQDIFGEPTHSQKVAKQVRRARKEIAKAKRKNKGVHYLEAAYYYYFDEVVDVLLKEGFSISITETLTDKFAIIDLLK